MWIAKQLAWLETALKSAREDWKICYFHHPLYSNAVRTAPRSTCVCGSSRCSSPRRQRRLLRARPRLRASHAPERNPLLRIRRGWTAETGEHEPNRGDGRILRSGRELHAGRDCRNRLQLRGGLPDGEGGRTRAVSRNRPRPATPAAAWKTVASTRGPAVGRRDFERETKPRDTVREPDGGGRSSRGQQHTPSGESSRRSRAGRRSRGSRRLQSSTCCCCHSARSSPSRGSTPRPRATTDSHLRSRSWSTTSRWRSSSAS